MTSLLSEDEPRRGSRAASILLAAPPAVVAVSAIVGLGVLRAVPLPLALAAGLALGLLPILGLRGLLGVTPARLVVASWGWSLGLLLCLPLYFPGERGDATEAGLQILAAPVGAPAAEWIAALGADLSAGLSRDPAPLSPVRREPDGSEPGMSPGDPAAGLVRLESSPLTAPESAASGSPEPVLIPYQGDERSLQVDVDIDGPASGERVKMIFDTGATFSTLDAATLERIGISIPGDAPIVTLRTANGELEAPLVLVDAIWLGDAPTEWVTVAVCESCATPPTVGLLGLNVSRGFRVALDHDRRRIELRPRLRGADRSLDVTPWLSLRSRAMRHWDGAVDLELNATSRAGREIERTIVDVECSGRAFAVQLDAIPPKGTASTSVSLPRGTDCSQQALAVSASYWRLDRF